MDSTISDICRYQWSDSTSYHYFIYEPIKWRVLSVDGDNAFLLADKGIDTQRYYSTETSITWEKSTIRNWLNDEFYNVAFSGDEKTAIKSSAVNNKNNISYNTKGGKDTTDKVFLLSEAEVYSTDGAASYGFVKSYDTCDEARRAQSSTYAFAMGNWIYPNSNYAGSCEWWLRSPGIFTSCSTAITIDGSVHNRGYSVSKDNVAVRPALNLNLSSDVYTDAGTVCTDGTVEAPCDHTFEIVESMEATCTENGYSTKKCTRCNKEITQMIKAPGHEKVRDESQSIAATCTSAGIDVFYCKNCETYKEEIQLTAPGHKYGAWKVVIVPDVNKEGERQRECRNCNLVEKESIAAISEDESFVEFNDNKPLVYAGYKMTPVVEVYHDGKLLTPDVDYTIKFSGNQNASTDKSTGKYTITYKGEHKSLKKETRTFEMAKANVEDTTIFCTDLATYAKPGAFKAKVYVDLNGYTLKASDYTIAYYLDEACTIPMDSKHKLEIAEGENFATAYVKVTGKDKNLTGSKVASFNVYKKPAKNDSIIDISKCKLVLDASAKKGMAYTGEALEPAVTVMNGKVAVTEGYEVEYVGNIQKGTATIIVKGDGEKAVGSKVVSFKIK